MHGTNQQIKECIDLRACAYPNWYKKFRKITPQSICIPLSDEIVSYLLDEIIILPKECYGSDDDEETQEETKDNGNDSEDEDPVLVNIRCGRTNNNPNNHTNNQFIIIFVSNPNFLNSVRLWPGQLRAWVELFL